MHILVTGASGSGTSTLGQALASEFELRFVDADDIYWLPTKPAFREKRDAAERLALLRLPRFGFRGFESVNSLGSVTSTRSSLLGRRSTMLEPWKAAI